MRELEQEVKERLEQDFRIEHNEKQRLKSTMSRENYNANNLKSEYFSNNKNNDIQNTNENYESNLITYDLSISNKNKYSSPYSNFQSNSINDKSQIRNEIKNELDKEYSRKERIMKMESKRKVDEAKKNIRNQLEVEIKQQLDDVKEESERERCEIARLKAVENVRLKKLKDLKKETDNQLTNQRESYEKVISDLRQQVNDFMSNVASENNTSVKKNKHFNNRQNYHKDDDSIDEDIIYGTSIKDQMHKMKRDNVESSSESRKSFLQEHDNEYNFKKDKSNKDSFIVITNEESRENEGTISAKEKARQFVDSLKKDNFYQKEKMGAGAKLTSASKWKNRNKETLNSKLERSRSKESSAKFNKSKGL